ncbi:MAG: hypothetical protein GF331_13290 [Chitinivibrionales bacterium]|nr:hypothetical protein [Chitinivibrionales bacterium]
MEQNATRRILDHFTEGFKESSARNAGLGRRIGAELKFPFVDAGGNAVARETLDAFWAYLAENGWKPDHDKTTGKVVGARTAGAYNDSVASCETGYCKAEFSLAHVGDLFELQNSVERLRELVRPFLERERAHLLCYGMQPLTPPSSRLLMKKARAGFWDRVFPSNEVIPPEDGDDVHMFTVNATSHVHVSVAADEAVRAVNVLNGFAGAQIALTANSPVWRGRVEPGFCCVNEHLWDCWRPAAGRVGVPARSFDGLDDYVASIAGLRPVFVKRDGVPLLLGDRYDTFADYFGTDEAVVRTVEGEERTVTPEQGDIGVHNSCYWYSARISRYYTVENRVCDQQPADALIVPAALTLGLVAASEEAWKVLAEISWQTLRELRAAACRDGIEARADGVSATELCGSMLDTAEAGLRRRGKGEEAFLQPLRERLAQKHNPATAVVQSVNANGIGSIVDQHSF